MELPEVTVNLKKMHCPQCGNELPAIRFPDDIRQALAGGWTCEKCQSRIDRMGNLIGKEN